MMMLIVLFVGLPLFLLCIVRTRSRPTPPPPPQMDLASANCMIARLKAELQIIDENWVHDTAPLRPGLGENERVIRELRRELKAKLAENSALHEEFRSTWMSFDDRNQKRWDTIMESCTTVSDQVWLVEQFRYVVQLENELLRLRPHLRHSIEHMRFPVGMC